MTFLSISARVSRCFAVATAVAIAMAGIPAAAHPRSPSEASVGASALSVAMPVAISVAGPVLLLSAGVSLTVVTVQASAVGTVWVLERTSDGARVSVQLSAAGVSAASMAVGTVLAVTALSTGWLLSSAGQVIAFIPNEIGASLIHNERITY